MEFRVWGLGFRVRRWTPHLVTASIRDRGDSSSIPRLQGGGVLLMDSSLRADVWTSHPKDDYRMMALGNGSLWIMLSNSHRSSYPT